VDFNPDFNVAIATAAPVIALSCIVLINGQVEITSRKRTARKAGALIPATTSYWLNGINITAQAVIFYNALYCLAIQKNYWPYQTIAIVEALRVIHAPVRYVKFTRSGGMST
jgi:hypothetical protein